MPARKRRFTPSPAERATVERGPSAPTRMRPVRIVTQNDLPYRISAPAASARAAIERSSAGVSVARKK